MGFAEGVTTGDQRDGFFVIHRHALEGLADVFRGGYRVGITVGSLRIHVDQAHLHGAERVLEFTITVVAFVAQPFGLGTPVNIFLGFPNVGATATEAEGLEAHRFERDVAGQDHEVGPRNLVAVFLFDRPEEPACLVEIGVVRPGIERSKTLLTGAAAAATIAGAIGAGAMPGHADEERAIVTKVGRPPVLRVRHQCGEIGLERLQIEFLELGRIIKILAHRIRQVGILVQDFQVKLVRPPVAVGAAADAGVVGLGRGAVEMRERAFAAAGFIMWCVHMYF